MYNQPDCKEKAIDLLANDMQTRALEFCAKMVKHRENSHKEQETEATKQTILIYTTALSIHIREFFEEIVLLSGGAIDSELLLSSLIELNIAPSVGILTAQEKLKTQSNRAKKTAPTKH